MSFTSFTFLLVFTGLACWRRFLGNEKDKWLLLLVSILFYMTWSVSCLPLILGTAIFDYHIARRIAATPEAGRRRAWLVASLAWNLGILGFFKYANFAVENVAYVGNALGWRLSGESFNVVLPPAISYFTFSSLSYVIDVYYERIAPCQSARDYALFVTFFPKLLSGPITRASEFLPRLERRREVSVGQIEAGLAQFLLGAVKKLAVADNLALGVNPIFASPGLYDRLTLVEGVIGYGLQLYCDFSGYCDMGIGTARLLGFELPENFQFPFSAVSIAEFWRRWHITLTTWLRDYVFLPLEIATRENPRPLVRVSINLMITMVLCGLWHGASWNFVIFGAIHGLALVIHKIWAVAKPSLGLPQQRVFRLAGELSSRLLTLAVILTAWIFFRAETFGDALEYFRSMILGGGSIHLAAPYLPVGFLAVLLGHLIFNKDLNWAAQLPEMRVRSRFVAFSGLILALALFAASGASPFIYINF